MNKCIQVGVIGAGRIGQIHASNLYHSVPGAALSAITDVNMEAARNCAAKCGGVHVAENAAEIFADPAIDAVLICTPTDTHARLIEEAAAAGKQIFCEKPIALDLKAIDRALEAVKRAGVCLQIGFNRRFDANFRRVRKAVQSGEIGTPHLLHIISRDPAPPPLDYVKVSGGIFLDMTIHDFDMARYLMGCEVTEIYTAAGVMVDPAIGEAGDLDTALITLKFENGALGTIDNSRKAVYGYDQRVEVFGSQGSISTENNYPNTAIIRGPSSVSRDLPLHFFLERYMESFREELRQFLDAVRSQTPPPVTGHDSRIPVLMGLAARRSYEENRPVRLDEFNG